jgi:hypothetical protein
MYANMSKIYVKDSNGKYKLVDKNQNESKPLENFSEGKISLEEILARVKRLESIVIDPRR